MGASIEDQLVAARAHVEPQRNLVAHRPAGQKQRRLVPEQLGNAFLQVPGRGIEPALLVPTSAAEIAARIPSVGRVCVSL